MHLVQATTLIHDRYISSPPAMQTRTEVYHLTRAVSLFSQKLSAPLQPSDGDALWAAANLLGIISFSLIEGSTPEEVWPLKPSSASDLEWIRIGEGKNAVMSIARPLRHESLVHSLKDELAYTVSPPTKNELITLPSTFDKLYGLGNPENNPYYTALHALAPLLHMEYVRPALAWFYSFTAHIKADLKVLLHLKDPRAMLLLAYWYALICNSQWWITRRAVIECQSICLYLERYCAEDAAIQELLQFPRMRCRLVPS
jgi:hypothetical protein